MEIKISNIFAIAHVGPFDKHCTINHRMKRYLNFNPFTLSCLLLFAKIYFPSQVFTWLQNDTLRLRLCRLSSCFFFLLLPRFVISRSEMRKKMLCRGNAMLCTHNRRKKKRHAFPHDVIDHSSCMFTMKKFAELGSDVSSRTGNLNMYLVSSLKLDRSTVQAERPIRDGKMNRARTSTCVWYSHT